MEDVLSPLLLAVLLEVKVYFVRLHAFLLFYEHFVGNSEKLF